MASLNSLVQDLADTLDGSYDYILKKRLEDIVIGCRAVLIRQEFTRTRQFPAYAVYEVLMPLKDETCLCSRALVPVDTVPKVIDVKLETPFSFVGTEARIGISFMSPEEIEFIQYNKVSGKMARYTYMNKKPYIFNANIDNVLLRAPFADPRELIPFNCGEFTCFDKDMDFIEEHMKPVIKKMALEDLRKSDNKEVEVNGDVQN